MTLLFRAFAWGTALALAGWIPSRAVAQSVRDTDTTLARLTAEAIAANPSLGASQAMARAAAARVRSSGALPDPMVSAGVMDLTLPRFAFRESDFTEVDFEVSEEFPWPGTLGARTRAARAEARARDADVGTRRREVAVRVAELYYRLRYVVTARATLRRQRELLATAVDIATIRYATSSAPQSDPLQARVALTRLDAEDADLAQQQVTVGAELKALRNVRRADALTIELIRPETVTLGLHKGGGRPLSCAMISSVRGDVNSRLLSYRGISDMSVWLQSSTPGVSQKDRSPIARDTW